jgi:AcrR family transcriptional regulator
MAAAPGGSRQDRRKALTRAALVSGARRLLETRDSGSVSIQEITEAADVGFGTFYNHFESKQDLFAAAIEEVVEEHGAMLDALTADLDDPAEILAASVRMTAQFPITHPNLALIMERTGPRYLTATVGLGPRALRDLRRGKGTGRFSFGDPAVALACTSGAMIAVLHLSLADAGSTSVESAADELAFHLLRMVGLDEDDAGDVVSRPLPQAR